MSKVIQILWSVKKNIVVIYKLYFKHIIINCKNNQSELFILFAHITCLRSRISKLCLKRIDLEVILYLLYIDFVLPALIIRK